MSTEEYARAWGESRPQKSSGRPVAAAMPPPPSAAKAAAAVARARQNIAKPAPGGKTGGGAPVGAGRAGPQGAGGAGPQQAAPGRPAGASAPGAWGWAGQNQSSEATRMQKAMQSGEGKCRGKPLYDQEMPNACVLASCRMVIRELTGVEKDEEALMNAWTERGYSINSAGSDPSKIGAFLASQGVPGAWLRIPEGEDTKSKQQWAIDYIFTEYRPPFLVGVKNGGFSAGHCIIVDGCSPEDPPKKVKIRDPAWVVPAGCREIPIKEFNDRFDPRAGVWILRGRL